MSVPPLLRRRALSLMTAVVTAAGPAAVPSTASADVPTLVVVQDLLQRTTIPVTSAHDKQSPASWLDETLLSGTKDGVTARSYLRFDMSYLPQGVIRSATLRLTGLDAPACGPEVGEGVQVRRVTEPWSDDFLHWGNKPASTGEGAQIATKGVTQQCAVHPDKVEWPVTDIVNAWAAGAENHGLVLQSPDESTDDGLWTFSSWINPLDVVPVLTVTMDVPSAPYTRASSIATHEDGPDTWVAGLTPRIQSQVADPAGGSLTAEFEVEHDPAAPGQGGGQIWTATSAPVSSFGRPSVVVPSGLLEDGWRIRWRVRAHNLTAGTVSAWSAWNPGTVAADVAQITARQVVPSYESEYSTVSMGLTPELRATVTHPLLDSTRVVFQMAYDPDAPLQGTGLIWEKTVLDVPSGGQAVVTVPDGLVEGGLQVRWRVGAYGGPFQSGWSEWQKLTLDM
ncbi:DNRLRE domain-containing protein [Herbidospora sp. NEAU-GS84]|uniref:DNRLRE domain-containing protein n=1 Tax=Herbidospora solisilvae TaxID=2696284 RepID=A0A7C9J8U3_9ACTN|nr:DNRLRE domain-containing protein [Herbidospora solisilvae]NAS27040.1 DNRLRE domain-containing protein [Herbidospora solisilvae]